MLAAIGVPSIDTLFEVIPADGRLGRPLAIEPSLDEARLMDHLGALAEKNVASRALSFVGGGIYDHHVPPAVDQLLLRSEFYTAYTPYQAEVAQGTLQAIFEFQTIVSELFGMPVASASMYDGASAAAEEARPDGTPPHEADARARESAGAHPGVHGDDPDVRPGAPSGGERDRDAPDELDRRARLGGALEKALARSEDVACVVIGYPNFYGAVQDVKAIAAIAHAHGALLITATAEPYAMALLESPGALGADIAVGEGQALGLSPQNGGPGCGLFACRDTREFLQNIPGRLCGETVDKNGQRGYVLTLSTREQHIRRDRATSNICTNHALCALAITIRACLLGKQGFVEVAKQCLAKAEHLKKALVATGAWELPYSAPTFNEFVVRSKRGPVAPLVAKLAKEGILAGIDLSRFEATKERELLVCVTERHSRADLDRLVAALG